MASNEQTRGTSAGALIAFETHLAAGFGPKIFPRGPYNIEHHLGWISAGVAEICGVEIEAAHSWSYAQFLEQLRNKPVLCPYVSEWLEGELAPKLAKRGERVDPSASVATLIGNLSGRPPIVQTTLTAPQIDARKDVFNKTLRVEDAYRARVTAERLEEVRAEIRADYISSLTAIHPLSRDEDRQSLVTLLLAGLCPTFETVFRILENGCSDFRQFGLLEFYVHATDVRHRNCGRNLLEASNPKRRDYYKKRLEAWDEKTGKQMGVLEYPYEQYVEENRLRVRMGRNIRLGHSCYLPQTIEVLDEILFSIRGKDVRKMLPNMRIALLKGTDLFGEIQRISLSIRQITHDRMKAAHA